MRTIPALASFTLVSTALLLGSGGVARAETSAVSASGFTVTHATAVDTDPQLLWQALTQLPQWWNNEHTWSGRASNMSIDASAGGCWCERWDGSSVAHGRMLLVQPGSVLRLHAWLGPLQELPIAGVLTFGIARRDGVTRLRLTYRVGGPPETNLDKLAPIVDTVLGEQVRRLKSFAETGKPQ